MSKVTFALPPAWGHADTAGLGGPGCGVPWASTGARPRHTGGIPEESTPAPDRPGEPAHDPQPGGDPRPDGNIQDVLTGIMGLHKRIYELEKSLLTSGGG